MSVRRVSVLGLSGLFRGRQGFDPAEQGVQGHGDDHGGLDLVFEELAERLPEGFVAGPVGAAVGASLALVRRGWNAMTGG